MTGLTDAHLYLRECETLLPLVKIAADVDSVDLSGVSGTPEVFVDGKRHHGAYGISTLSDAVRAARARC